MYVRSGTHMYFHRRIIVVLTQNPTVLMFLDITGAPQTLPEIWRNMGICCGFGAVAARENIRGSCNTIKCHERFIEYRKHDSK